jgi:hypothetical protein
MEEIALGKYKIEVMTVRKGCPKKCLWIGAFIGDYAKGIGFE